MRFAARHRAAVAVLSAAMTVAAAGCGGAATTHRASLRHDAAVAVAPAPSSTRPVTASPPSLARRPRPVRRGPAPVRVSVAGHSARVVPVGTAADGSLTIPTIPTIVGWWSPGPGPGDAGNTVLAGHVDSHVYGLGFFYRLWATRPGDPISVTDTAGHTWRYRVVAVRDYLKAALPVRAIFRLTGPRQLVLVTCAGHFTLNPDGVGGTYSDNEVVTARPPTNGIHP